MGNVTEAQIQYLNELGDFVGNRQDDDTIATHGDVQHDVEQLKLKEAEYDESVFQGKIDALRTKVESIFGKLV
jgi:uncharacterized protein YcnI